MPQYRRKPALTEATQWLQNGDHPQDQSEPIDHGDGTSTLSEGKVVRFFRAQHIPGGRFCHECGIVYHKHGLLQTQNGDEKVCPGDYIVTDKKGNYYKLTSQEFEATFELYEE